MKFIDQTSIHVKAGSGGHGCIAFLREKFRPKGGPCGGDGGQGGNVVLRVEPQLNTLLDISLKKHYKASNGEHGKGKNMHGKNGEDVIINLPPGTIVKDSTTKQVIIDLKEDYQEYEIASGGKGGFGNARFKTQTNTAPRNANDGQSGKELELDLELKVIADVGLVGLPNAGKSTLISSVSNAKPKVADYRFTTLTPNLGIVKYGDFKSFVMADIPGLISGASKGKGLGNQFLKHIERTKILVFLIDISNNNIENEFNLLYNELENHDSNIGKKPIIIVYSKYDLIQEDIILPDKLKNHETMSISSVNRYNLDKLISKISIQIDKIH